VEQELFTVPEHLDSFLVFSGVRVVPSVVFYVMFCRSLFALFLLSVFLRFTFLTAPVVYLSFS
jgi:hypothetical protein